MSPERKSTSAMVSGDTKLHVIFIPFLMHSHLAPLVDIARLFAARGVRSTIITTVQNATIFQTSIDSDIAAGHPLTVQIVKFPASEVGLPIGTENLSSCNTNEKSLKLMYGVMLLQKPIEKLIRDLAPDCIFSDMFFPWTVDLAEELKIPRLVFHPTDFFYHAVRHTLKVYAPYDKVKSESESFVIPNLPDKITMKRSQIPLENFDNKTDMGKLMEKIKEAENRSYGVVNNTFYEIEPAYIDHYQKISNPKIWPVGPVFQFFSHDQDHKSQTPNSGARSSRHSCLSWLDDQKPKSVIYVCFGSAVRFPDAQITEIAMALEESKKPFIWVVRGQEHEETIGGLPEGFKERMAKENKGLVITGWAPQVEILKHPAIGGFLNHCGWNSVLEAVVNGVPLLAWPLFTNQCFGEKLVVDVLGIGVSVGVEVWNSGIVITSPVIEKRGIVEAIWKLTDETPVAETIRRNVQELSIKAKRAVQEGGSSFNNITALIEDIKGFNLTPKPN